jgi:hypothetical protein
MPNIPSKEFIACFAKELALLPIYIRECLQIIKKCKIKREKQIIAGGYDATPTLSC